MEGQKKDKVICFRVSSFIKEKLIDTGRTLGQTLTSIMQEALDLWFTNSK